MAGEGSKGQQQLAADEAQISTLAQQVEAHRAAIASVHFPAVMQGLRDVDAAQDLVNSDLREALAEFWNQPAQVIFNLIFDSHTFA